MKGLSYSAGIIIGIVITLFLIRIWNKDGRLKTKYDEMQEKARGKAYMYGFWTILSAEAIISVLITTGLELPFDTFTLHIIPIIAGISVQVSYSIWNNAYIGINTNIKRFMIISTMAALLNILCAAGAIASKTIMVDGQFTFPVVNLMIGVLFIAIAVECLIKNGMEKNEKEN